MTNVFHLNSYFNYSVEYVTKSAKLEVLTDIVQHAIAETPGRSASQSATVSEHTMPTPEHQGSTLILPPGCGFAVYRTSRKVGLEKGQKLKT